MASKVNWFLTPFIPPPMADQFVTGVSMSKAEFIARIGSDLVPILTEAGFRGQELCWKRVREPYIDCVEIQARSDDAACCMNLAEHLTFLPVAGGSASPDIETMTSVDCELKARLSPDGKPEHWWKFENATEEVRDLIDCFQTHADNFFGKYHNFPKPFTDLDMAAGWHGRFARVERSRSGWSCQFAGQGAILDYACAAG